jgi:hypothetical protein
MCQSTQEEAMSNKTASLLAGLILALPLAVLADTQPKNPDYAHALPDLRTARFLLEAQPGDPAASRTDAEQAIKDIDSAINAVTGGGFNDHKAITDHAQITVPKDRAGRLNQALEYLHRAHAEISKEVGDPAGVSVRNQALEYIDKAGRAVGRALEAH